MKLHCGTGNMYSLLNYLVNTARAGNFTIQTQPYHYAFGNDRGSYDTYTVSLIQDKIEIQHVTTNRFEFSLNVQYISG
jgi:hypothetical protein